jgi:SAM-dependent methyltransferase
MPFPDCSFDCVYSVTVLEECDVGRAIGEVRRILRPGGRAGIVVRALDLKRWWHLDLPGPMSRKADTPPYSISPAGVADRSLYRRMREATDLACFPTLVTLDRLDGPIWHDREDHVLSLLSMATRARPRGSRWSFVHGPSDALRGRYCSNARCHDFARGCDRMNSAPTHFFPRATRMVAFPRRWRVVLSRRMAVPALNARVGRQTTISSAGSVAKITSPIQCGDGEHRSWQNFPRAAPPRELCTAASEGAVRTREERR